MLFAVNACIFLNFMHSESEDDIVYYSTKLQLEELMQALDPMVWDKDLCQVLSEAMPDILDGMKKTEELTSQYKGSHRSCLDIANGKSKLQTM